MTDPSEYHQEENVTQVEPRVAIGQRSSDPTPNMSARNFSYDLESSAGGKSRRESPGIERTDFLPIPTACPFCREKGQDQLCCKADVLSLLALERIRGLLQDGLDDDLRQRSVGECQRQRPKSVCTNCTCPCRGYLKVTKELACKKWPFRDCFRNLLTFCV